MKIIDSNKDFYDYYQNIYRDDTFTFDRRDSYNLSKEEFAREFYWDGEREESYRTFRTYSSPEHYILLQIGNWFWTIKLTITEVDNDTIFKRCKNYTLECMDNWRDYDCESKLIELSHIDFQNYRLWHSTEQQRLEAILRHEYKQVNVFNKFTIYKGNNCVNKEERHIPILQNIGIAGIVNPLDIYLALEEYFAMQKTNSEKTEPVGFTNEDKIVEHGFDVKTSFRGK